MVQRFGLAISCLVVIAGCAGAPQTLNTQSWQASTLSEQTIVQATQAGQEYFSCIQKELTRYRYQGGDSRYETQSLLRRCEDRLTPIRSAFAAEGVDPRITERYLRRKRTQAARYVLETIMGLEARHRAAQAGG